MLQLEFIGYLTADAVQRTHEGKQFTCFNVGVTQRFKDRAGNKQERTKWINCIRACTPVDKYLKKGVQVHVRGDASARAYLNNQHEPQAELVCRARDLLLLDKFIRRQPIDMEDKGSKINRKPYNGWND